MTQHHEANIAGEGGVGWTPGPWEVEGPMEPSGNVLIAPVVNRNTFVAYVIFSDESDAEAAANARLIAAAPELYEALAGVAAHYADCDQAPGHSHDVPGIWDDDNVPGLAGQPCEWCATWASVHAALAKAAGK